MNKLSESHKEKQFIQGFLGEGLQIEPSSVCNLKCSYCFNKHIESKGLMTLDNFKEAVDQVARYVKVVTICGFGEPFCNPHIYSMLAYLKKYDLHAHVATNGMFRLNEEHFTAFQNCNLGFSVDALSNDVFNLSRPGADAQQIIGNIRRLTELRKIHGADYPTITVRMNIFTFNKHQIFDLINTFQEIGIKKVNLKRGWGPKDVMTVLDPELDFSHYGDFVTVQPMLFRNPENAVIHTPNREHCTDFRFFKKIGCICPTIRTNGNLSACCFDMRQQILLGNIFQTPIDKLVTKQNLTLLARKINKYSTRHRQGKTIQCDSCLLNYQRLQRKINTNDEPIDVSNVINQLTHEKIKDASAYIFALRRNDINIVIDALRSRHKAQSSKKLRLIIPLKSGIKRAAGMSVTSFPFDHYKASPEVASWVTNLKPKSYPKVILFCYENFEQEHMRHTADIFNTSIIHAIRIIRH